MKPTKDPNQGEGDRLSARRYNDAAKKFAKDEEKVDEAARKAAAFVDANPEAAHRAERKAKRGPHGTRVSVDELVDMGRSFMDRVRPYVDRAISRVKSTLNRRGD